MPDRSAHCKRVPIAFLLDSWNPSSNKLVFYAGLTFLIGEFIQGSV